MLKGTVMQNLAIIEPPDIHEDGVDTGLSIAGGAFEVVGYHATKNLKGIPGFNNITKSP